MYWFIFRMHTTILSSLLLRMVSNLIKIVPLFHIHQAKKDITKSFFFLSWYDCICLGTGYPEKRDDTIAVETALQDDVRIQHILQHLYAISVAMKYVLECYLLILFRFIIRQSQLINCHIFFWWHQYYA